MTISIVISYFNNGFSKYVSRINTDWLWEHFPNERRFGSMIFVADNVLVPEVIQAMYRARKSVEDLETSTGDKWDELLKTFLP